MKQNTLVRLAVVPLALLLGIGLAQTALAQWSNDPNISATICTTVSWRSDLSAVSDGAGGIISAWPVYTDQTKVVCQRLSSDGIRLWLPERILLQQANGNYLSVRVVSDQASGAIVAVGESPYSSGLSNVRLLRVNSQGVTLWTVQWSGTFRDIVNDGAGGAIVAWTDSRNNSLGYYAQRINASGNFLWNATGVPLCPDAVLSSYGATPDVKISSDGSGGAVFAWTDYRNGYFNADVYAQRVSGTGVVQWPATGVPIAGAQGFQAYPLLTPDGTGGAFVAWRDYIQSSTSPVVYAQRINAAGIVQWTVSGINISSTTIVTSLTSMVSDGSGGAVVAWVENISCGNAGRAQRLNGSGTLLWPVGGIDITGCQFPFKSTINYTVINDGAGGFIAVWNRMRDDQINTDVYAQRINATGARQWISTGVPVSTYPGQNWLGIDSYPSLVLDGRGGVVVPWNLVGFAEVDYYVLSRYAQRLNLDGTLGAPNMIVNGQFEQGTTNWTMYSAVPNGINFSTVAGGPSGSYAKVHINATSNNMQVYQTYFPLTARKRYTLGFDAYSPTSRKVFVTVHKHGAPYGSYGFGEWIQLGPNWTHYERQFTAAGFSGTTSDTRLRFYFVYACGAGDDYYFDNVSLAQVLAKSGEEQIAEEPTTFLLEQNFPNPFNPTTEIRYRTTEAGHVTLTVYDVLGREVATLVNAVEEPGYKSVKFDATNLSSGMYFYKLESGSFAQSKKMLIIK